MLFRILALFCLFAIFGDPAHGAIKRLPSYMPENDLWKQDNKTMARNISETEWNQILDKIEGVYRPIFSSFGANFVLERKWDDPTVNAYAQQEGMTWSVTMFGGMARRPEINVIGFGLVACHEIGHHLAGFPKYQGDWAANEGQSDYFSTMVCAKKVLSDYPVPLIPASAKSKCDAIYSAQSDRDTCYKSMSGGLALSELLAALGGNTLPSIDTPDPTVVSTTSDAHPAAQCRLDTYVAGALCAKAWNDGVIPTADGATCSNRPRCWFAPAGGGDDPGPNPKPEPKGGEDVALESYINNYRGGYRLNMLAPSAELLCAALWHSDDIYKSKQCGPYGSDHSDPVSRARVCGFYGYTQELLVCGAPSPSEALNFWLRYQANQRVILSRAFTKMACARSYDIYDCVLGQ